MSFLDNFKGNQYKAELEKLRQEYEHLQAFMTPEMQDALKIKTEIERLQNEQAIEQQKLNDLKSTFTARTNEIRNLESLIQQKNKQILYLDEEILVQEFGLYKPQYDFASALDYKEALTSIRTTQKELIKNKEAVTGDTQWEVNGNKAKGKKMVTDTQKLLLRAFNVECDELISKVRYTNFDASLNKINKSAEAISKLGTIMNISITQQYLNAKKKELRLAFEYQLKKKQEKEKQKAARAEQGEKPK